MIMGSPHPAALYWGEDYIAIYNEAYISLAGQKHPRMMGARYRDTWPEIWDDIAPVFDAAWNSGDATMKHDDTLFITRHGFTEETYFNWAIIPLVGGDGTVVAIYNPAFENTRRRIVERRMLTLQEIGIKTAMARDVKGFWGQLQQGLEYNELDVPFALIYSVGEDGGSDVSSLNSGSLAQPPQIVLEGSIGVPDGHACAVPSIDLRFSDDGFAPYMRDSMVHSATPIVLREEDGTLPTELIQGVLWAGFGDPCRTIVVFPVHPTTTGDAVVGFIVLGMNPRRPYNEDYQLFIDLLSRQLATSLASVVLFEEEIRRGQKAARLAALDRQELSLQLHLRTQEAVESEYRFTRMAEFGPVGLFIADGQGDINYCNEMWYRISGLPRDSSTFSEWMQKIRDEDRPGTESAWRRLVDEKIAVTHEFRFQGSRELIDGHCVDVWALMSAYPERDETGELKSIFGCITDISQQKWAEYFQKQRRIEAVEMKRQQENFIDITSHEMRNPLSAILQCADEISSGLSQYRHGDPSAQGPGVMDTLVDSCVEAASIISLCANHQKRIVDDILTLSKLDSNLLLVTPVDVQPIAVVHDVLKMFETELGSHGIEGKMTVEQSYRDLDIDWVKLDPSRLRQVLINLMTNAIKFAQGQAERSIVVRLGASKDAVEEDGLSYIPPRQPNQEDLTDEPDWADGEKTHLHFAVTDSGPGLDDDEKRILFQRFSQTSPRTHVQYGGSGLGLFICRTLTELQGGRIAVQSEKGQGSTFAFYIKGRKLDHPPISSPDQSPSFEEAVPLLSPLSITPTEGITPAEGIPSPTARPATPAKDAVPPPPPPPPRSPLRQAPSCNLDILIVEDNLVNQKVLNRQLQLSGSNTYVANHGGEALAELRRSRFWNCDGASTDDSGGGGGGDPDNNRNISVILMDLEMPVMDGISCTREIRRLEAEGAITQHIPIIAVTAYARPEQVENAKAAGVVSFILLYQDERKTLFDVDFVANQCRLLCAQDGVISKPFRISELIPKIEELVLKYGMLPKAEVDSAEEG
jgi:PAS domain S-box-containing protein